METRVIITGKPSRQTFITNQVKIKIVIFRAPGIRVKSFHGTNKKERLNNLEKIQRRWGVCLTTYGKLAVSFPFFGNCCSVVV